MPRPSAKQLANRQNGASGGQRTSQNRSIMQAAKAAVYNAWRGVYEEAEETIEMVDQGVKDGEILTHHPVQSAAAVTQDAAAAPLECECDCTKSLYPGCARSNRPTQEVRTGRGVWQ